MMMLNYISVMLMRSRPIGELIKRLFLATHSQIWHNLQSVRFGASPALCKAIVHVSCVSTSIHRPVSHFRDEEVGSNIASAVCAHGLTQVAVVLGAEQAGESRQHVPVSVGL